MIRFENSHGRDSQGVILEYEKTLFERLAAIGCYHATCTGARAEHQREYSAEWPRLLAMREHVGRLIRTVTDATREALDAALAELERFERYMRAMTEVKWQADAPNIVTTVGRNAMLDAALAGSSYTAATYMGLIGAVSYSSAPVAGDTMSSHSTWTEGGGTNAPTYSGNRKTVSWSSAGSAQKAPSSAPAFDITGSGTAKGVFIVYGSGASATKDNTSGTLYSAGLFTGGDQAVVNTNTVTVTYTTSLTSS